MKNNIKTGITTLFVVAVSFSAFAQDNLWTLQKCVDHALENNITIVRAQNTLLLNEQDVIARKGAFLPTVSGNAGHNMGIGTQRIDIGKTQLVLDRTSHNTNFGVRANQTIFNGFMLTNLHKQSLLNLETNQLELERIKDDVSLNVVNAYLNILFNKENLETANAQHAFSKKQLDRVNQLVEAGSQPKANIYDAEATLSRDLQNVTVAENNYELSLLTLSQLLQVDFAGFNVEIISLDNPSSGLMYTDATPILEYAMENRNEIKVAQKSIENSKVNSEISKGGFYPTVTGSYNYGTNSFFSNTIPNEDSFFKQLNAQKGHTLNLNVNIPIFSGYKNKTAVAKSLIQEENSELNLTQTKLNLESNILRAFTDAKSAYRAFEAAKVSLKSQKLAFGNAEERYDVGMMNAFDLEQSRLRLVNAESSLIKAKYDFIFKTKVLDFYFGKPITE